MGVTPNSRGRLWRGVLFIGVAIVLVGAGVAYRTAGPTVLVIVAVIVAALALVTLILPAWIVRRNDLSAADRLKAENDVRSTLVQSVGGAALVAGLLFTWQNFQLDSSRTYQTLELARESEVSDRFIRAVGQLGDSRVEVRVGGIYALERIAKDSPKDQPAIMDLLATLIREHAPTKEHVGYMPRDGDTIPPGDILAAATVLARHNPDHDVQGTPLYSYFLALVDLRNGYLPDAHFRRFFIFGSDLEGAILPKSDLREATLSCAHLEGAVLKGAHLESALLDGAYLAGADLKGAVLKGVDLTETRGLTQDQFDGAVTDSTTKPPDFKNPRTGAGPTCLVTS